MKQSSLYIWLTTILVRSVTQSKQIKESDHKRITEKVNAVYGTEFLKAKGERYGEKVSLVTRAYAEYLIKIGKPIYGIAPIMRAIKMCASSDEEVSSLHTHFAMLCLKAKCFQHSIMVIDHPITSVMKGTLPIEIMTYNYYRGLLNTGLQRFPEAIECFRKVLSQPTNLCHAVHIEAYYKVSILNLIVHGETFDMKAGNVSSSIQREIQNRESRLMEMQVPAGVEGIDGMPRVNWHAALVDAWQTRQVQNLEEVIGQNFEQLQENKQLGLAQRLLQSLIQKKIADLSATYITLSFAEIAEKTGIPKANLEEQIAKMISEDVIKARISASTQTVEFIESEEDSGAAINPSQLELIRTLEKQNTRIVKLMGKAEQLNRSIKLSEEYIQVSV